MASNKLEKQSEDRSSPFLSKRTGCLHPVTRQLPPKPSTALDDLGLACALAFGTFPWSPVLGATVSDFACPGRLRYVPLAKIHATVILGES